MKVAWPVGSGVRVGRRLKSVNVVETGWRVVRCLVKLEALGGMVLLRWEVEEIICEKDFLIGVVGAVW